MCVEYACVVRLSYYIVLMMVHIVPSQYGKAKSPMKGWFLCYIMMWGQYKYKKWQKTRLIKAKEVCFIEKK